MTATRLPNAGGLGVGRPGVSGPGWLAFGVAALVIMLDQAVKAWVLTGLGLAPGESLPLVWPLALTLVRNDGISFGFFQTHAAWTRWVLAAFSLAVSAGLALWVRRTDKTLIGLAVGLILGGALGNLVDRVRLGAVTDFVDVHPLMFPWIFNIADSGITIGVFLMLADNLLGARKPRA
jgi:signal peptidase II